MTNKVKEEVALRDTNDLITDHNEQGEPLGAGEPEAVSYSIAEVFGPSAGINFKCLRVQRALINEELH